MKKRFLHKITGAILVFALTFGLAACGAADETSPEASSPGGDETSAQETSDGIASTAETSDETASTTETPDGTASTAETQDGTAAQETSSDKKIIVGANPVPHADILETAVKPVLAEAGWELEVVVFQDYVLPNTSLEAGELDANYFQTLGYMNQQNEDAGLHLAAVAGVHIEPMGIYSQKYQSLDELPDGAEIGIPNDPENTERGLNLLVQKGLLTSLGGYGSDPDVTAESLVNDAEANPRGFKITTLEAANLPLSLPDLDAATINGNYALGAGLPEEYPALEIEEFDEETSVRRTNFIVVLQGNEETEKTRALVEAMNSDAVKQYIEDTYKGSVIPSFIDPQ